jgi:hypothetical protein
MPLGTIRAGALAPALPGDEGDLLVEIQVGHVEALGSAHPRVFP